MGPTQASTELATVPAAPPAARGIAGTANFSGQLRVEPNLNLSHTKAYGRSGSLEWGEWEKIRRTDPVVAMALDFVLGPIRDAQFGVEPAETPDGKKHAAFVEWTLKDCAGPGWIQLLSELVMGSLGSGFALHEPSWTKVGHESLPGGRGWGLAALEQRLPSSLSVNAWMEDDDGKLIAVRQEGMRGPRYVRTELPADNLMLTTWQREGTNYAGFSVFRPVWYNCKVREELSKIPGVALVREGAGIPIAYAEDTSITLTPDERADLEETLRNLIFHEAAHVVMKPGWKLEWLFSGGANKSNILDTLNHFGKEILQCVHAQQLMLGVNETGSRSVGVVHDKRAQLFIQGVIANLLASLNGTPGVIGTGIVRRLIDYNWGPQAAYPKVTLTLKPAELEPDLLVTAISTGKTAGVFTWSKKDENDLRARLGMSPAEELPTGVQAVPAPAPEVKALPVPEVPAMHKHAAAVVAPKAFAPSRPLRPSELVLNVQRMATFLDEAKVEFERKAKPAVAAMLAKALPKVRSAMGADSPEEVATMELDTEELSKVIREWLKTVASAGAAEVMSEIEKGGAPKAQTFRHAGEPGDGDSPDDDQEMIGLLDVYVRTTTRRITGRLKGLLESEAIDAVRTGADADEVLTRVMSDTITGKTLQTDGGAVLTRAWNGGREFAARQLGGVNEVELSAVLDSRTCDYCRSLDGERFEFQSSEHDAHVPPLRDCDGGSNCRCLIIYIPAPEGSDDEEETDGPEPLVYPTETEVSVPVRALDDLSPVAYSPDKTIPIIRSLLKGDDIHSADQGIKISTDTDGFRFAVDGNHRAAVAQVMGAKRLPVTFKDGDAARNDAPREKAPYDPALVETQQSNFEPVLSTGTYKGKALEPEVLDVLRKLKRYGNE